MFYEAFGHLIYQAKPSLKAIHKEQKIDEIDGAVEALNKSWEAASQEMYKATQEQQAQGTENDPSAKSDNPKSKDGDDISCLLYTSPSPRDGLLARMPSSA